MIPEHMTDLRAAIHFIADVALTSLLIFWCYWLSRKVAKLDARITRIEADPIPNRWVQAMSPAAAKAVFGRSPEARP